MTKTAPSCRCGSWYRDNELERVSGTHWTALARLTREFHPLRQLVLENIPAEELEDIIDWCIELGLPVTLKELGITEVTDEKLMAVATAACAENDTLHNMPFEVTPETVCAAIKAADAYGKYFLGE